MIIMPGQTVAIDVPMKKNEDGSYSGEWKEGDPINRQSVGHFVEVPPPRRAPHYSQSEELGIVPALRAEKSHRSWRCCQCHQMQQDNTWQVWVPDGVMAHDPDWSVTEAARRVAYNGGLSAWCLRCAKKLGRGSAALSRAGRLPAPTAFGARRGLWRWLFGG